MSDFPDIDEDFAPIPLGVQVARRLARHESHQTISAELGLSLDHVRELASAAVVAWEEHRPTQAEELAVLQWAIDDTLTRVMQALDRDPLGHDAVSLFAIRLEALRLRSALIGIKVGRR